MSVVPVQFILKRSRKRARAQQLVLGSATVPVALIGVSPNSRGCGETHGSDLHSTCESHRRDADGGDRPGRAPHLRKQCSGLVTVITAALILRLATFSHAQDSQFLFDTNGNLFVQKSEVTALPQILGQPQNRIVAPDEAASFFVVALDTRALTYQWRFNGGNIDGATNDALLLQNLSTNNEGVYDVVLTNPSGSVTSAPAMLWFDGDGDGMADSFELTHFGNLNQLPNGDFDGEGSSNLQEFLDGTNPTNTNSVRFHLTIVRDGGSVMVSPELPSYTNGQNVTLTALASPGGEPFHAWLGDIASRDNPLTLVMTNNKTVFGRFAPVLFAWTNALSGDWNIATNWTPNLAPGSNDSVVIAVATGPTVTLNTSADCNEFVLGNETFPSTLTGSGTLTVHGNASWFQGAMSGSGRTVIEAGATLNVANASGAGALLNTRTLENGGTVQWIGAGSFVLNSSAVLTNRPGALLHVQNAASIQANVGSGRIDNAGTFRKSVNAGTTTIGSGISFNNSGAVEVEAGTLLFNGGLTNSGVVSVSSGATNRLARGGAGGGMFNALANAVVEWTSGTFTLSPGAQLNGAGLYRITSAATVSANTDLLIENLDLFGGTLNGSGIVTIAAAMNWTAGTMSGGSRTFISPGATLNVANASGAGALLNTRTLENGGTVQWIGGGSFALNSSAVLTNRPGALLHVQNAASIQANAGNGRIDNAGTFRKSVNAGTTTIGSGISFNNYGTVDIRSGVLAANGGYVSSSDALLNCALGGTTAGTDYGQLRVGGTVTLNGALSVDFISGFSPALNDSFIVLTAGTRNGTFSSLNFPTNQVTMEMSNTPTSVIVRVTGLVFPPVQNLLLAAEIAGSDFKLCWGASPNVIYRVEFTPGLNPPDWNALPANITVAGNNACILDPLGSSNRFYRVRIIP